MAWSLPKTWTATIVTVNDLQGQISGNNSSGPFANGSTSPATQLATQVTAVTGARAMYEHVSGEGIPLVYSNGHWVSAPVVLAANVNASINSTSYQTAATAFTPRGFVSPVAGVNGIQFRATGYVSSATGGETTTLAVAAFFADNIPEPAAANEFGATASASAGSQPVDTGWATPGTLNGTGPLPKQLGVWLRVKSSAAVGAKTQSHLQLECRLFF